MKWDWKPPPLGLHLSLSSDCSDGLTGRQNFQNKMLPI